MLLHPGLQRHFRAAQEVGVNPQTDPLAGGSLAAWSIPLQTQFWVPSFPRPQQVALYRFHIDDDLRIELARHSSG